MRFVLASLMIVGLVLPPTHARATESLKTRLYKVLLSRKDAPSKRYWKRLGHRGQDALIDLATGGDIPIFIRARALGSLSFYPNDRSFRVLRVSLNNTIFPIQLRQVALQALASAFRLRALDILKRYIYHADVELRRATATALRYLPQQHVKGVLRTALINEKAAVVRKSILKSLQVLAQQKRRTR